MCLALFKTTANSQSAIIDTMIVNNFILPRLNFAANYFLYTTFSMGEQKKNDDMSDFYVFSGLNIALENS